MPALISLTPRTDRWAKNCSAIHCSSQAASARGVISQKGLKVLANASVHDDALPGHEALVSTCGLTVEQTPY